MSCKKEVPVILFKGAHDGKISKEIAAAAGAMAQTCTTANGWQTGCECFSPAPGDTFVPDLQGYIPRLPEAECERPEELLFGGGPVLCPPGREGVELAPGEWRGCDLRAWKSWTS